MMNNRLSLDEYRELCLKKNKTSATIQCIEYDEFTYLGKINKKNK